MAVFDYKLLKEQMKFNEENKVEYFIGVDCYDKNHSAYCLMRHVKGNPDVFILAKTMKKDEDFKTEVENLAQYFNAEIIGEVK